MRQLSVCVAIATKNRRDDLRRALLSVFSQTVQAEVMVIDDGSTDGTSQMIREEFSQVRLFHFEESRGVVVQRNFAATVTSSEIIISIDDDAEFSHPNIIEQTIKDLESPQVGVVAIPYVDVNCSEVVHQWSPSKDEVCLTASFRGCAYATRREVFLEIGGYRPEIFHQGEERDYCLRLLERGYVVRLGNSAPIYHFESPKRDTYRMDIYGRRNDMLFVWQNVPWPYMPLHMVCTIVKGAWFGVKVGRPIRMLRGIFKGAGDIVQFWQSRRPVSRATYLQFRSISKKAGASKLGHTC